MKVAIFGQDYEHKANSEALRILMEALTTFKGQIYIEAQFLSLQNQLVAHQSVW